MSSWHNGRPPVHVHDLAPVAGGAADRDLVGPKRLAAENLWRLGKSQGADAEVLDLLRRAHRRALRLESAVA